MASRERAPYARTLPPSRWWLVESLLNKGWIAQEQHGPKDEVSFN